MIFYAGGCNLAPAPGGKQFAVFPIPENAGTQTGLVRVNFLQNFSDELRRTCRWLAHVRCSGLTPVMS
jgi:hypothetical protein